MPQELTDAQFIEKCIRFYTRHSQAFEHVYPNVLSRFDKIRKGEKLEEDEKISFKDFALVYSIALLKPYRDHLPSYQLSELIDKVDQCHNIIHFFEKKEPGQHFKLAVFMEAEQKHAHFDREALNHYFASLAKLVSFTLQDGLKKETSIKPG
jgi:hypothetical protein